MSNENQTQKLIFTMTKAELVQQLRDMAQGRQSSSLPALQHVVDIKLFQVQYTFIGRTIAADFCDNNLGNVEDTTFKGTMKNIIDGVVMWNIMEDLTRAKAYLLWEAAGCPEGEADKFWIEAEKQVKCN